MTNYDWITHMMPGDLAELIATRDLRDASTYAYCRHCLLKDDKCCPLDEGRECDKTSMEMAMWWLNQEHNQKEG